MKKSIQSVFKIFIRLFEHWGLERHGRMSKTHHREQGSLHEHASRDGTVCKRDEFVCSAYDIPYSDVYRNEPDVTLPLPSSAEHTSMPLVFRLG